VWGLEKPNSGRDRGETFFPDSGSYLDSDETFQILQNLSLEIDEIVCLLDSQLCAKPNLSQLNLSGLSLAKPAKLNFFKTPAFGVHDRPVYMTG
jgi:hypothetical protein